MNHQVEAKSSDLREGSYGEDSEKRNIPPVFILRVSGIRVVALGKGCAVVGVPKCIMPLEELARTSRISEERKGAAELGNIWR